MTYGKLTLVTGCMFAGKSSYIINAAAFRNDAVVFKPKMDIRYSANEVVTHDGVRIAAIPVSLPDDLSSADGFKLICLDEIQFFDSPYYGGSIVKAIKVLLKANKDVLVCGLDTDWKGDPFPITASLAAMADDVIKLKGKCNICKGPAAKTYKKTHEGEVVELGNDNIYEARCNDHWSPL